MQSRKQAPTVVAKLDLSDGNQHQLHDLIYRTHTGRWKSYRALAMRQHAAGITELAMTVARRKTDTSRFVVLQWRYAPLGFSWREHATRAEALRAFQKTGHRL